MPGAGATFTLDTELMCPANGATCVAPRVWATYEPPGTTCGSTATACGATATAAGIPACTATDGSPHGEMTAGPETAVYESPCPATSRVCPNPRPSPHGITEACVPTARAKTTATIAN